MSQSIDNRVVQMEFDNQGFERGVKTSLSSLEQLKKGLDLDKAAASLQSLEETFNGFSLKGLEDAASHVADAFSNLGVIANTVLSTITAKATEAGIHLAKALTVDNLGAGFGKYEQMMNATQTMKNATGKDVDEITGYLDKLMTYTDETSYSYSEMVTAMGRFTSAGVDLNAAESAVQGIANAAADAGIGIKEANRLFDIFSKSMSSGHLGRNQWDSLALANFNTPKFQKALIAAGKAIGTIDAKTGKLVSKKKGTKATVVTFENLADTLKDGWVNQEVLNLALAAYGDETDEAAKRLAEFDNELRNVGSTAYESAKVAKTFTDVIDSVKDAISSGWMTSFTNIFGGLEESMVFWTDVANGIIDIVDRIQTRRNEMLEGWKANGGYENLTAGIENIITVFRALYDSASNAFDIFTSSNELGMANEKIGNLQFAKSVGETLLDITQKFRDFTQSIVDFWFAAETRSSESETTITYLNVRLQNIFRGLYSVVGIVADVIGGLVHGVTSFLGKFAPIGNKLFSIFAKVGLAIEGIYKYFHSKGILNGWIDTFINGFQPIFDNIKGVVEWLEKFSEYLGLNEIAQKGFANAMTKSESPITRIVKGFRSLFDILSEFAGFGANIFSQILNAIAPFASDFIYWIVDMATGLADWITRVKESGVVTDVLTEWSKKVGEAIETLKEWGKAAWEWIDSTGILEAIRSKFAGMFRWIKKNLFGQDITEDLEKEIQHEIDRLNGNVVAAKQVVVKADILKDAGYSNLEKGIQTMSAIFGDQTFAFGMTPVLPNGKVLSPDAFGEYMDKFMSFDKIEDAVNWDKENKGLLTQYLEVPDGKNVEDYKSKLISTIDRVNALNEEIKTSSVKTDGGEKFVEETEKATGIVGAAQTAIQFLHDKLQDLAEWLQNNSLSQMLSDFFGAGAAFISEAFSRIGGFFGTDTSAIEGTGNKLAKRLDAFKNLDEAGQFKKEDPFNGFIDMLKGLAVNLNGIDSVSKELGFDKGVLDGIFGTIKYVIGKVGEIVHEYTSKLNFGDMAKMGVTGFIGVKAIKAVFDIFESIANVKDATNIFGNVSNLTESLSDIGETLSKEGISGLIKGKKSILDKMNQFAQSFLFIAGGIWAMADAMNKIKDLKVEQLTKSLLGEAGAGGILTLVVTFTKDFEEQMFTAQGATQMGRSVKKYSSLWTGTNFIAIAGAINMLAGGLKQLSEIEVPDLQKGLLAEGAMGALMGVIKMFTDSINYKSMSEDGFDKNSKSIKKAAKLWDGIEFLAIAKSINMLGEGIKTLGSLGEDDLKRGLLAEGAMGALLGVIKTISDGFTSEFTDGTVTKKYNKGAGFLSGLPFIQIAKALNDLSDGLLKISTLNTEEVKNGLLGLVGEGGILLAIKTVSDAFNEKFAKETTIPQSIVKAIGGTGVSFIAIANALNTMADALIKLKEIDSAWSEIGELAAMGGIATFLSSFLGKVDTATTQKAMLNLGIILGEISGVLLALGTLNDFLTEHGWDAAEKLQEAGRVLYDLGKAVGSLFGGFADGLRGKTATDQLIEELKGEGTGMQEAFGSLQGFGEKLKDINFDVIERFMTTMTDLYGVLNLSTINTQFGFELEDLGLKFNQFAANVDEKTVENATNAAKIVETFVRIGSLLGNGDALKNGETTADALNKFLAGATLNGDVNVGSLVGTFAAEFTKAFSDGIQNGSSTTDDGVSVLMTATLTSVGNWIGEFQDLGKNISYGIADGIDSKEAKERVSEAIAAIGGICSVTFKAETKQNSPSRLFAEYGRYLDEGLVVGIYDGQNEVRNAMSDLGQVVIATAENAIDQDFSFAPTITPIFDSSNITTGMNYMNGEFAKVRDIVPDFGRGTLQTELVSSTNSNGIIEAIDRVNLRVSELGAAIETMQIVMNGEALVGQISADVDRSLGLRAIRERRRG